MPFAQLVLGVINSSPPPHPKEGMQDNHSLQLCQACYGVQVSLMNLTCPPGQWPWPPTPSKIQLHNSLSGRCTASDMRGGGGNLCHKSHERILSVKFSCQASCGFFPYNLFNVFFCVCSLGCLKRTCSWQVLFWCHSLSSCVQVFPC